MNDLDIRMRNALIEQHKLLFDYTTQTLRVEYAEHIDCPVCGSGRRSTYFKKDYFVFSRCTDCSMVYLNPRLNNKATYAFYNSEWNRLYNTIKFDTPSKWTAVDDRINLANLRAISALRPPGRRGRLLEIGCGNGYFLKAAKESGYEVYGVELNERNYQRSRSAVGDTVYNKDLFDVGFSSDMFDVVYMRDVLEHVPGPQKLLQEIHRLSHRDSLLYIEVPNIDGLVYRIVKEKHVVIFGFEHLNYWSPATMDRILSQTGFRTIRTVHQSLDFTINHVISYLIKQQFSSIFSSRMNPIARNVLDIARMLFCIIPFRTIDNLLFPSIANMLKHGSVIKVFARKT